MSHSVLLSWRTATSKGCALLCLLNHFEGNMWWCSEKHIKSTEQEDEWRPTELNQQRMSPSFCLSPFHIFSKTKSHQRPLEYFVLINVSLHMDNTFHRFCLILRTSSLISSPPHSITHLKCLNFAEKCKILPGIFYYILPMSSLTEFHSAKTEQHNAH